MSYRPTVSIYLNGSIAEIYMMRGTEPDRLREFILALALFLDGSKSAEEVREKLKMPPADDSFLHDLELASEDPFLIDLSARCIYVNYCVLSEDVIQRTRVIDLGRTLDFFEKGQFAVPALYIPFDAIPIKEIRGSHAYWHFKNK